MNNEFDNNVPFEKEDIAPMPANEEIINEPETDDIITETAEEERMATTEFEQEFSQQNEPEQKAPEFIVTNTVKKKKGVWPRVIALSLVGGLLFGSTFGLSSSIVGRLTARKIRLNATQIAVNKDNSQPAGDSAVAHIVEECMPSVVAITNHSVSDVMTFFGTYKQESTSSGSGIIIGQNETELLIITNYHVVANTKELSVVFSPVEKELEEKGIEEQINSEDIPKAIVKGYEPNKDLAVIAVKLSDLSEEILSQIKIATIGDSSSIRPGDQIIAIGNALGYGQSVTTGIISAVDRKIKMESADGNSVVTNSFIQTDAAINSGNSGGALLDMQGRVIGINSVKIATTGVEGMGYAIPITDVEDIIDDLMLRETRELVPEGKQGFLGITGTDVTSVNSQAFGMPVGVFVSALDFIHVVGAVVVIQNHDKLGNRSVHGVPFHSFGKLSRNVIFESDV